MSDALKRRCIHLYIDFPDKDLELEIVRLKVPDVHDRLSRELVEIVHAVRKLDLKKQPSISETLDWARALSIMNVANLGEDVVRETLSTICKYEGDLRKAEKELEQYAQRKRAEQASASTASSDKDALH